MDNQTLPNNSITDFAQALIENTFTRNQALRRVRITKDFINFKLFNQPKTVSNEKQEDQVKQSLSEFEANMISKNSNERLEDDLKAIKIILPKYISGFNPNNLDEQFQQIDDLISKTKLVNVYLPFEMPYTESDRLGNWFKENLGKQALFEIIYDPNLIAGCALSINGVYKDYSIRQKIQANKPKILEVLLGFKKDKT